MSLFRRLAQFGRFSPIQLNILPVDKDRRAFRFPDYENGFESAGGFLQYDFDSNILIPVDAFSFTFVAPESSGAYEMIKDGDIVQLICNDQIIATGIIDAVEFELDADQGERVSIRGRDLLGQFEDQSAINDKDRPIFANKTSILGAVKTLAANTRIQPENVILQDAPKGSYFFPTEPGESKLSAILRFLEPLNCLIWVNEIGQCVVGKPNFVQDISGELFASRSQKKSNFLSCRVVRNATQIPNIIIPIWAGQELVQNGVSPLQRLNNSAARPNALLRAGHRVPKTVVVSHPNGFDPNFVNDLQVYNAQKNQNSSSVVGSNSSAANGVLLQQWAKRELARANMNELLVDITVPGHYNENGDPYAYDTVYKIDIERAGISQKMYLYAVKYQCDADGQKTLLSFCNLNTIVADAKAP